ncbi:tripartite tricarboxylate transporter TctB family protein [uncultured Cohaesibacter sp.]|uniref:tripartite tricarboxylate transporter TctB family protein n=1 Tax=uncultured Cohaesibacter sp. TaxID=1002546 RepID=UPI0029C7C2C8|nr:tripartite tricarboxylate transporter TctB family protein [uncultured Cohaesibacter sp.]
MSGKRSDIFIATGLLIFCLILALFTLRIPSVSAGTSAGPSFVPWLMLGCIAVFSLLMIVSNLISAKRQSPAAAIGEAPGEATGEADTEKEADARLAKGTALRIAVFILLLLAYATLFMSLGYLITTLSIFIAGMFLLGERKLLSLVILPGIIVAAIYYGFTEYLNVWLP